MGALRRGVSHESAERELDAAMARLAHAYPLTNRHIQADALTFWDAIRGPQRFLRAALGTLQAILLLVLIAVCGNTACLVLARSSARDRELGVRLALGATPWRMARLLVTENVVLGAIAAVLGSAAAVWGTRALRAMPPLRVRGLPIAFDSHVDGATLLFAVLLGLAGGAILGAVASAALWRADPMSALRAGVERGGRSRFRSALIASQAALGILVLIAAGVFLRSLLEAREADPGFRRDGILLAECDLSDRKLPASGVAVFADRVLGRLRAAPGIMNPCRSGL